MGDKKVATQEDREHFRSFTRAVLTDLQALERMHGLGALEQDVLRIGAEQEMFLVDSTMHPASIGPEIIAASGDRKSVV